MNTINCHAVLNRMTSPSPSGNSVRAVIDIGSNSVKLLVGQVRGTTVEPIYSIAQPGKLGQGVFQTRRLGPEAIDRTADAVAKFAALARGFSPSSFRILATSAVREAINRADLLRAVEDRAHHRVELLSGEDEAQLLFEGVRRERGLGGLPLLVVGVGGGSTQLILSERGAAPLYYSFPFGSLRLLEAMGLSDPLSRSGLIRCRASAANFVSQQVVPAIGLTRFEGGPFNTLRLIGTGKKLRSLASAAGVSQTSSTRSAGRDVRAPAGVSKRAASNPALLAVSLNRLSGTIDSLWPMSRGERAVMVGIAEEDANVVLIAAITLEAVLNRFDFDVLHVSCGSLRQGAILTSFTERRLAPVSKQWI
jgi:exopolyphosphatase/guanosine-5'-triphosphate,3'-diphosphate pyrophosphatase